MAESRRRRAEPDLDAPLHCTPEEQRRLLGQTPFFRVLPASEIVTVATSFHQQEYAPGERIHRAGDPAARLSLVAAGMVKIARPTLEGEDVLLDFLRPGDYFGSLGQLGDAVYQDDAVAQTHCCILYATASDFQALLARYPAVALATLDLVAQRLRAAHETIEQLSVYPVPRRLAATLLNLSGRLERPDQPQAIIELPVSRQDLADMTGTTVETVSRVLSDFRRSGLIESGRGWAAVRDADRLAAIAGQAPISSAI